MLLSLKRPLGWTIGIAFFAAFGIILVVYDVWATINPSPQHLPLYLMPFECLGFVILLAFGRRHDRRQQAIADAAYFRGRTPASPRVK